MNRTIEDIQKEIETLNKQYQELTEKEYDNRASLNFLKEELKAAEFKLTDNTWYKNNPLSKYYKRRCCSDGQHNVAYYINIDDKIPNKYDRSIKKIIKNEPYLKVDELEFIYSIYGDVEVVNYQKSIKMNVGNFKHFKENKPGNHGEWTPTTEEEFDEVRKYAAEFIINNNI